MNLKTIGVPTSIETMILSNINLKIKKVKLQHIAFRGCESIEDMEGHLYVLQKKGRWIKVYEDERKQMFWHECSECKCEVSWKPNFCPNCGADMRGKENE